MEYWSHTLTSWPGSIVDGHDGQDKRGVHKKFVFPGMKTELNFPTDLPVVKPLLITARSISFVIADNDLDPNIFDLCLEFEVESSLYGRPNKCFAHCGLYETDPAINPNQQAVAEVRFDWTVECGIHIQQLKTTGWRAVRAPAAKRATIAWFYFVCKDSWYEGICPGVLSGCP